MQSSNHIVPISGVIQQYAWGKHGVESEVAKLHKGSIQSFDIQSSIPYAELWFGTHPKGTSNVISNGEPLNSWLSRHSTANKGSSELPFLFKVLSVETALSIQIHPNKIDAVRLHESNPNEYPDSNHKPEMAIALTPFEALCGFRPIDEIKNYILELEELQLLTNYSLKEGTENNFDLKSAFSSLMNCDVASIKDTSSKLYEKINTNASMSADQAHKLYTRLYNQFPGDVGCFCVYFFNYIVLQPGQSLFLQSNLPHAYLYGDCIECMACSDNVIRAGLTPKFRDVQSLCKLVDYTCKRKGDILFEPVQDKGSNYIVSYEPPVPEFAVQKIDLPKDFKSFTLPSVNNSSILIVVTGQVFIKLDGDENFLNCTAGSTIFIGSNETVDFVEFNGSNDDDHILMFRAFSQL